MLTETFLWKLNKMNKEILKKIPAIVVMIGIFALSALPSNDPLLKTFEFSDKIKHFIAYFVLGITFCLWITTKKWNSKPFIFSFIVVMLCTVFGVIDEFHQSFVPGRSGNDLGDLIADIMGGTIAPFIYILFHKLFFRILN